jgi:hypothetical protein
MVSSDNPSCPADYWRTVFLTKALFSQAWHGIHQRPRIVLKAPGEHRPTEVGKRRGGDRGNRGIPSGGT